MDALTELLSRALSVSVKSKIVTKPKIMHDRQSTGSTHTGLQLSGIRHQKNPIRQFQRWGSTDRSQRETCKAFGALPESSRVNVITPQNAIWENWLMAARTVHLAAI